MDPPERSHLHKRNSVEQCEDDSSVWTKTDGGNSDICNLADFSSDKEDIPVKRNSGCQDENIIGVTTCNYSDLSDSEDSEWEDAENRAVRRMVQHYNFDLIDGMTPMEYVPIPRESRRKWPKEDLIYRPKLREPDIESCASVFHTELASPRLETAVPPPVSVDVEVPSCREIKRDVGPWKRAGKDMDITSIIMANLNDHNNLGYGDRPVTEAAPELMTKPDETLVTGTFPAVIDHPEPTENLWP